MCVQHSLLEMYCPTEWPHKQLNTASVTRYSMSSQLRIPALQKKGYIKHYIVYSYVLQMIVFMHKPYFRLFFSLESNITNTCTDKKKHWKNILF